MKRYFLQRLWPCKRIGSGTGRKGGLIDARQVSCPFYLSLFTYPLITFPLITQLLHTPLSHTFSTYFTHALSNYPTHPPSLITPLTHPLHLPTHAPSQLDQWDDPHRALHIYARAFGEMSILTLAFLLLPITHNSVWETVFGVPFDRGIKYHRALGVLFWIYATLHMVMFEIKWLMDGVWRVNAYESPDQWVSVGTASEPLSVRVSNWTIPLMEFTWLLGATLFTSSHDTSLLTPPTDTSYSL